MPTFPSDETPFDDVMIDIETMSLHPHKALILSVGMIEFDPRPINGLRLGSQSLIIPEIAPQLLMGRRVDVGTQKFWADQPVPASDHWTRSGGHHDLEEVIHLVRQFCKGRDRVWANGTQFDLSNLIGLADDLMLTSPLWHYQAPRDMRTFVKETQPTRLPSADDLEIAGVAHEPIYDCVVQATQVWSHWQT